MTTFRILFLINNGNYEPKGHSSLDEWVSSILDIPIDEFEVGDIARAIRQDIFLAHVLPKAEIILRKDPLAGEDYEGQLISSIASLNYDQIKSALPYVQSISSFLNQMDQTDLDSQVVMDIVKIDKLSRA